MLYRQLYQFSCEGYFIDNMKKITIRQQSLNEDLKKRVYEGFSRHAIAETGFDEKFEPVAFVAMGAEAFAGAVVIEYFWGALHVKYVYVEDAYRGQGIGTRLIQYAFDYGKEKKCSFAFVETMSFQAMGFYQKMGFELEFTRPGYSHGTSFHYLRKDL